MSLDEKKKQFLAVLIFASILIPLYLIYMTVFGAPLVVSIFASIYSLAIILVWIFYSFGFFIGKKQLINNHSNGSLLENEESLS